MQVKYFFLTGMPDRDIFRMFLNGGGTVRHKNQLGSQWKTRKKKSVRKKNTKPLERWLKMYQL